MPQAWARWALPSMADVIFIALILVLAFTPLALRLLGDAGIGWHIRTGQLIAAAHAIPRVDPFSSTMAGKAWIAWEWLYDLMVGRLESAAGLNGVVWFTAVVIATVFGWTFRLLIERGTNVLVATVLVLLAVSASMIHFLARPHVLSWLLTLAWFWILDSSERDRADSQASATRRRLWLLPLLMLVWANLHGGFVLGFMLLGIFSVAALWDWLRAKEGRIEDVLQKLSAARRLRVLTWIGLLSALASLANPYGWKLHGHIFSYLTDRFLMDHVEEFQSPNFHGVAQRCFAVLILIALATLALRGRTLRTSAILTLLFAVYAGLYASRNIPVASVLLVIVVGSLVPSFRLPWSFLDRVAAMEAGQRGHLWPIIVVVGTLAIAAHGGRLGSDVLMDAHFDANRMPVAAVDYLEAHDMNRPVLSPDYWGGYMIYRLYPKTRVVVDDRHDLYGAEFLKSYLQMIHIEPGGNDFLEQHADSCLLFPRNSALAGVLLKSGDWNQIYGDDVAVAFVHRHSPVTIQK